MKIRLISLSLSLARAQLEAEARIQHQLKKALKDAKAKRKVSIVAAPFLCRPNPLKKCFPF